MCGVWWSNTIKIWNKLTGNFTKNGNSSLVTFSKKNEYWILAFKIWIDIYNWIQLRFMMLTFWKQVENQFDNSHSSLYWYMSSSWRVLNLFYDKSNSRTGLVLASAFQHENQWPYFVGLEDGGLLLSWSMTIIDSSQ